MVKKKISAVIVEDELSAREALRAYLSSYCPQVEVQGEATDARQAVELIRAQQPQLVFLDVEMPFGNAFDVLEACKEQSFETIFVTAFSEYSLRALNQSAAYYLLKPLSIEELISAVDKVAARLEQEERVQLHSVVVENFKEQMQIKRQVVLPTLEGFEVIRMEDILRLQGNGNFTDIYLKDGSKKMACRFLKHYEDMLPPPFLRVHKSHILNLECVKSYHKNAGGYVMLTDGTEVDISAQYKEEFLAYFK